MFGMEGLIQPLIKYLSYSDLIAVAGVSRAIRRRVRESVEWQNILTEWKRPTQDLPITFFSVSKRGYIVKQNGSMHNFFYVPYKDPKSHYTLMEVKKTWRCIEDIPRNVFKSTI